MSGKRHRVAILVGLAGLFVLPAILSASERSGVDAAGYTTTGKGGSTLRWLPQASDTADDNSMVIATQHTTVADSEQPAKDSAIGDPFGDKKPAKKTVPSASGFDKDVIPMPSEPKPLASPSRSNIDEPSILEKPYVAPGGMAAPPRKSKPGKLNAPSLLEDIYAPKQHEFNEGCPSPKDLKPIRDLNTNITPSEGELPHDCPLGNAKFHRRSFAPITYTWTASNLCHKPLYFEDEQVERYGHSWGPISQTLISGAKFFLTFPILPYEMGLEPPTECLYDLGYYRSGDCAPYMLDPLPLSVRGALYEAGGWVGGCVLFP